MMVDLTEFFSLQIGILLKTLKRFTDFYVRKLIGNTILSELLVVGAALARQPCCFSILTLKKRIMRYKLSL
jgi:hypothetical protein